MSNVLWAKQKTTEWKRITQGNQKSTYRWEACSAAREAPTSNASKKASIRKFPFMAESPITSNRANNSCKQNFTYADVLSCNVPVGVPSVAVHPTVAVVGCNVGRPTLTNKNLSRDCQQPKNLLNKSKSKVKKSSNQMSEPDKCSILQPQTTARRILYNPPAVQMWPTTFTNASKKLVSSIKKAVPSKRKDKNGKQKIRKNKKLVSPQGSEQEVSVNSKPKSCYTKIDEDGIEFEAAAMQGAAQQSISQEELKRKESTIGENYCEHHDHELPISISSHSTDSKDDWLKSYQSYQAKWQKRRESRLKELHEIINEVKHINTERHGVDGAMLQLIESMKLVNINERRRRQPIEEAQHVELPTLTSEQNAKIENAASGAADQVLNAKFGLNIKRRDIRTLYDSNWLNDELINFYMNLLIERSESQGATHGLPRVYAMNTFFVPRLLQSGYSGVQRWTRKVDIFTKDIIPVPVHMNGEHWSMAIIHLRQRYIRYYDSLGRTNTRVLNALEQYLRRESIDKRHIPLDTHQYTIESVRNLPRQTNHSDCGVFSCMFAEYITRNEPITFSQQNMPYFRNKMILEILGGELLS